MGLVQCVPTTHFPRNLTLCGNHPVKSSPAFHLPLSYVHLNWSEDEEAGTLPYIKIFISLIHKGNGFLEQTPPKFPKIYQLRRLKVIFL